MNKQELLFYNEYEEFYTMAEQSEVFQLFCKDAFGADFSQDGFSDIKQIDMILPYVPNGENVRVLDVGCGNGKMLGYLQSRTNAFIHGFDYSEQAIKTARRLYPINSEFQASVMGEVEYPENTFDIITSMDTIYFAKDMVAFVAQIKKWLKSDGIFFVGYQEGDVMPKTESVQTTEIAKALEKNGMLYEVFDITKQTYNLLKKKREAAMVYQEDFRVEGHVKWFEMLMFQTECATISYEEFSKKMARYIFVAKKERADKLI